jgi:hypothetical protein
VPQLVQHLAQIVARMRLGHIRPEGESQVVARLGSMAVEQQVSKQGLHPRLIDRVHRLIAVRQVKIAQQLDVQEGHLACALLFQ